MSVGFFEGIYLRIKSLLPEGMGTFEIICIAAIAIAIMSAALLVVLKDKKQG